MKLSNSKKELREFGLLIGIGFPLFIGFVLPAITGHMFRSWTLIVAIPFLILGIVKPQVLFYPYKSWMALGHVLGWINSRIILGMVFLIVLQPIALIMKSLGYDPLKEKKNNEKSYREIKKNQEIALTKIF